MVTNREAAAAERSSRATACRSIALPPYPRLAARHASAGELSLIGPQIKFPAARQTSVNGAAGPGRHTVEVLRDELGYTSRK